PAAKEHGRRGKRLASGREARKLPQKFGAAILQAHAHHHIFVGEPSNHRFHGGQVCRRMIALELSEAGHGLAPPTSGGGSAAIKANCPIAMASSAAFPNSTFSMPFHRKLTRRCENSP